jgi:hypothetical protein
VAKPATFASNGLSPRAQLGNTNFKITYGQTATARSGETSLQSWGKPRADAVNDENWGRNKRLQRDGCPFELKLLDDEQGCYMRSIEGDHTHSPGDTRINIKDRRRTSALCDSRYHPVAGVHPDLLISRPVAHIFRR